MTNLLIFTDVSEPCFANVEGTAINCKVAFPHLGSDPVPFTATANDPSAPHGELIFEMAKAGQFGPVAPYVEPIPLVVDEEEEVVILTKRELRALTTRIDALEKQGKR